MDRAAPCDDELQRIVKNRTEAGSIATAEGMRNQHIVNGRRARGRLLAVLSAALLALASWGLSRFPAKAETPHTGSSQNRETERAAKCR